MAVYDAWGPEHFPDSELKPLSSVKMLLERGQYSGYGLYDGSAAAEGGLLGYALLMHDKGGKKCCWIIMLLWKSIAAGGLAVYFFTKSKSRAISRDALLSVKRLKLQTALSRGSFGKGGFVFMRETAQF